MSGHRALKENYFGPPMVDPGDARTITVDRNPATVPLTSAAAETRTLARPTRAGVFALLFMQIDGGDITLTVTGGYNETGDTSFTFSDTGQFLLLVSCYESSDYVWRRVSDYGIGNLTPAQLLILFNSTTLLNGITATAGQINNAAAPAGGSNILTAAGTVLAAADNNKVFFIDNATGFVAATLPPVATSAGLRYTFINKTANTSGNHTIVTDTSENKIVGNQNSVAGDAGDFGTTDDTISFVANQSVPGDKVELFCDGTKWYAYAISKVAAGVTFTTAS